MIKITTRDAVDTLRGYFYQFDYSILKLLNLEDEDSTIVVEGIEDVDVQSLQDIIATQCKYYAKTEYNHSVISKPIRFMLEHFVNEGKPEIKYHLYGHYKRGQYKLPIPFDVEFLKDKFLTYRKDGKDIKYHEELKVSNEDLKIFLEKLHININAYDYREQNRQILTALKNTFKCSEFEAEHYYYNNALKIIKDISVNADVENRKLCKKEFLRSINSKESLFNEWFILFKTKTEFYKAIKKQYFPPELNTSPFERFFLIDTCEIEYNRSEIKELIFLLVKNWGNTQSNLRRVNTLFCPYIYLHNISDEELLNLKIDLSEEGIKFTDGHSYLNAPFSPQSIIESPNKETKINIKIINNISNLNSCLDNITKTKEIYQFYREKPFFTINHSSIKHIRIPIQNIKDVKEVV